MSEERQAGERDSDSRTPYRRINRLLLRASGRQLTIQQKTYAIFLVTFSIVIISLVSLYNGINVIFPHFFYLPIIMTAYWFPRNGINFSICIAVFYVSEYLLFGIALETIPRSEWVPVLARSFVYVLVGAAITILRWEGYTLNRIIGEQDKFVFMKDKDLGYYYFSPSSHSLLRMDEDEGPVNNLHKLLGPKGVETFQRLENEVMKGDHTSGELEMVDDDGNMRSFHLTLNPIVANGEVQGYESIAEDITDLMDYKQDLEKALEQKTALLAELHHRVRNNLAIIIGLLEMQSITVEDEDARRCLKDAEARIMAISAVHADIFDKDDFVDIPLQEYLEKLLSDIHMMLGSNEDVTIDVSVGGWAINHSELLDLSIVITEIFTNSLKHAFPSGRGSVQVTMDADDNACSLRIADDGIGLPDGFKIDRHGKLGLKVVKRVVQEKLKGRLELENIPGTAWTIVFPCQKDSTSVCSNPERG